MKLGKWTDLLGVEVNTWALTHLKASCKPYVTSSTMFTRNWFNAVFLHYM